jgi:hypothetical protein
VRFTVEIGVDGDGRVAGSVTAAGGRPSAFSGGLELLRLLEPGSQHHGGDDPLPATGDRQEI